MRVSRLTVILHRGILKADHGEQTWGHYSNKLVKNYDTRKFYHESNCIITQVENLSTEAQMHNGLTKSHACVPGSNLADLARVFQKNIFVSPTQCD